MIADQLISGHVLLSDWLFLIAAVLFAVEAILVLSGRVVHSATAAITPIGLALVAVGWLVL